MSTKMISPVYPIFTAGVMTGTAALPSIITNISYRDNVAIQLSWTGTPTGTFQVLTSLDYNPGLPQSGGAYNAGQWNPIPALDTSGNPPVAAGAAGLITMNLIFLSTPWIQTIYTNTSGTGVLTGYIFAKSVG